MVFGSHGQTLLVPVCRAAQRYLWLPSRIPAGMLRPREGLSPLISPVCRCRSLHITKTLLLVRHGLVPPRGLLAHRSIELCRLRSFRRGLAHRSPHLEVEPPTSLADLRICVIVIHTITTTAELWRLSKDGSWPEPRQGRTQQVSFALYSDK